MPNKILSNKRVVVTGGTGSLGKVLIRRLLSAELGTPKTITVFSRDEAKQHAMRLAYQTREMATDEIIYRNFERILQFHIGDVRDYHSVCAVLRNADVVFNAAALKQVPTAEYNPMEAVRTNVLGAQNVIDAALDTGVKVVVALSTDKAAAPINLYGATKLVSDKLFIAANNIKGHRDLRFSVVRYGNVMGSRGSVIPFFLHKRCEGCLPITHPEMTRFNISLAEGVEMVLFAIENALGAEIFVPKIPSYRILTLVEAIAPSCKVVDVGIRPGEKLHEEMITSSDSYSTIDFGQYFAILPSFANRSRYLEHFGGQPVPPGFCYNSGQNSEWLEVDELRRLIRLHVDPAFEPL